MDARLSALFIGGVISGKYIKKISREDE